MKYLDIAIANETIKTTDIKGKEYAEVNQRIKAFRMNHPLGSIKTNIESLENGVVVMSCEVKDELGNLLGKAYAYEKEDSSFINRTSFIENCDTSCTGRALGYAGYGIDVSVASAEEVQNAIQNQEPTKEEAMEYVIDFGKHKGKKLNEVPKEYLEWMLGNANNERIKKLIELATGIKIPDEEEQEERINFTNEILRLADEKEIDLEEITTKFKVDGISDMTTEQMKKCIIAMQKKEV